MKVLIITTLANSLEHRSIRDRDEKRDACPRGNIFENTLNAEQTDLTWIQRAPWYRKAFYKFLPNRIAMVYEAFLVRHQYDAVLTWFEQDSALFGMMQRFSHKKVPHVGLLYWVSKPNVRYLLTLGLSQLTRIVTWTTVQLDFLINQLGYSSDKVNLIQHYVDSEFWRPTDLPKLSSPEKENYFCSAGAEMRDYQTLIDAMEGQKVFCHVGAKEIRVPGFLKAQRLSPESLELHENMAVRKRTPQEMRDLYHRAKFVVVPLLPSDTDNGVTVILEALSMGKAVICSQTEGQRDVITNGDNGILVPQGDSKALREAILDLWNNPEKAEAMGKRARQYIEESQHDISKFSENVRQAVEMAIQDSKA